MQCPRCSTENGDHRSACVSCFAQLDAGAGAPRLIQMAQPDHDTVDGKSRPVSAPVADTPAAAEEMPWLQAAQPEEAADQSKYVIPSLAEPVGPANENTEQDHSPWKNNPENEEKRPSAQKPTAERADSIGSSSPGRKFPVVPVVGALVLVGLIAAWWILLFNPSPIPAAKEFINSGAGQSIPAGLGAKIEATNAKVLTNSGDKSEVSIDVKTSAQGMDMTVTLRVALVKEGSIVKKQWTVDKDATQQLAMQDMDKIIGQAMAGSMKALQSKMPAGPKGMPGPPGRFGSGK